MLSGHVALKRRVWRTSATCKEERRVTALEFEGCKRREE
jgi:hypothetical protein